MTDNPNDQALSVRQSYGVQLRDFENGLLGFLQQHGLPSQSIFVPISERAAVFQNVQNILDKIPDEYKENSVYISKFIAAVASGLFDAALNYMWDETIFELRKRVAQYDLQYFFDNAVPEDRRKKLKDESDLVKVIDSELIHGSREIELISELGFRHLDYIRYMRNWASAAHPNQNQLTGLQLISWLETCVKEVISLPLSNIATGIGKLLKNIKTNVLSAVEAQEIAVFFINLNQDQVNTLAAGLFGIYTREETTQQVRQNVQELLPFLWERVDENTRNQFGVKYGKYAANNDQKEKELARQFLDLVSGQSYIPDALRAAEIQIAIENLLGAHRGINNFYNEPPFARTLERLIGKLGKIPKQVNQSYVMALVEVFLTNGYGVAWAAEPPYKNLIDLFDPNQALMAILSFSDRNISSRLQIKLCQKKYRELLNVLKPKLTAPAATEVLEDILAYKGPLDMLKVDSRIKRKVSNLQKILS